MKFKLTMAVSMVTAVTMNLAVAEKTPNGFHANYKDFTGNSAITNIYEMDRKGLTQKDLSKDVYSAAWWPFYRGVLGFRYRDRRFYQTRWNPNWTFGATHRQFRKHGPMSLINSGQLMKLSASEKYDWAMDDTSFTLTNAMWGIGKRIRNRRKKKDIQWWEGICDGYSASSMEMCRPIKTVYVVNRNGDKIPFTPTDTKALGSLAWRNKNLRKTGQGDINGFVYIGTNCKYRRATTLGGRLKVRSGKGFYSRGKDWESCYDVNAASLHLILANRVANKGRGIAMDWALNHKVSNYPLRSFRYTYFNPKNGHDVSTIEQAIVNANESRYHRRFNAANVRTVLATKVVGIKLVMNMAKYRLNPSKKLTDGKNDDEIKSVTMKYELALDNQGNILGGEHYSRDIPDTIWAAKKKTTPISKAEQDGRVKGVWNPNQPIPLSWQSQAKGVDGASAQTQPIYKFVHKLYELSCSK